MKPSPLPALKAPEETLPKPHRLSDPGFRNLLLGGIGLLAAAVVFVAGLIMAGPGPGLVGLGCVLLTLALIWILARTGLLRQPNGAFLTAAAVLGAAMLLPLLIGVFMQAHSMKFLSAEALARPGASRSVAGTETAPLTMDAPQAPLPLLADSFPIDRPDSAKDGIVSVTKDSKIKIRDHFYRINAGEQFIFRRRDGDEVIFQMRDFLVSLPASAVIVEQPSDGKTSASPSPGDGGKTAAQDPSAAANTPGVLEVTRAAQAEAIKRYPALSIKDSHENSLYVEAYMKLKDTQPDFFNDPEWPLLLAEGVAEREGWKREDAQ